MIIIGTDISAQMYILDHRFIVFCFSVIVFYSCYGNRSESSVDADQFKVVIPFKMDNRGIIIESRWGNTVYPLYFDNHSPAWLDPEAYENNQAVSLSDEFAYRTSTADGNKIKGDVFICDSVLIGDVAFRHVLFYSINKNKRSKINGVFGANLISKGIWKINFKDHEMMFASHIDSLGKLDSAKKLTSSFSSKGIKIDIDFLNGKTKQAAIDLGFNWGILLPAKDFEEISTEGIKMYKDSLLFSTPGGTVTILSTEAMGSVQVNNEWYTTQISSNPKVNEKLVGLLFFRQFEYIILDYINHDVYISGKRMDEVKNVLQKNPFNITD